MVGMMPVRVVSLCALLSLWTDLAMAAPDVAIPPECGSAAGFESEVRARVGEQADAVLRNTTVRIERDGAEFRLDMQVGREVRAFRDASCAELFRAAVVVAVSLVEGPAASRAPLPQPAAAPQSPPVPTPSARDAGNADGERSRPAGRSQPRIGIGAGVGTNFGLLPHPSFAAELVGSALWEPWGVAVRARYFAPASTEDAFGRGVEVQAAGAELAASWLGWRVLEVRAGGNVRAVFGSGKGSPSTSADTAWAAGPIAGVAATPFLWGDTWVGLGADVALNLAQPRFEILQYGEVFHSKIVDVSLFLGAGHLFR